VRANEALITELLRLSPDDRARVVMGMTPAEATAILYDWRVWARPKQVAPPGRWQTWLNMAGRGYGKTRVGAEFIQDAARRTTTGRLFLLGATTDDVRETMIWGESGIMAVAPPHFRPRHEVQRRRLVWPNGATARLFSGEEPNRLRGPQHEYGWIDELAAFKYPQEAWDQAMFGLRLGALPQVCVTTTPKPLPLLVKLSTGAPECAVLRACAPDDPLLSTSLPVVVTTGTSYENRANLSEMWYDTTIKPYEGTRLGEQEIMARLLTDVPGALWKLETIAAARLPLEGKLPDFKRLVVACDPAVTTKKNSSETGIIVAAKGDNGHGYVLADLSGKWTPLQWAQKLVGAYNQWDADRIVGEVNNGGDLIETNIRAVDASVSYRDVRATRGKAVRAEPIAALYEQGKIHHVGTFGALESQMTTWVPDAGLDSPDRMDALVWALTDLMLGKKGAFIA
jgi:phage terminase large subunit-like protein